MNTKEQFEAWYLENWGHTEDDHATLFERGPDGDEYYRLGVRMAHEAWQAASKASEQQLTESRREFTAANATIHNLELSKAELAAELSAIEAIHNDAVFITDEHYEQCPPEVQKIIVALAVLKIPAYDAYLAEVRAQGVEMYAEATIAIGEEEESEYIVYAGKQALLFAAQLRQGAKS